MRRGLHRLVILGVALTPGAAALAQQQVAVIPHPQSGPVVEAPEPRLDKVDFVRVDKSERRLWLMAGDRVIRSYSVSLGRQPLGQKQQEGDQKTPEGIYRVAWRNPTSVAYRSMRLSYPNEFDRSRARKQGVSPGGEIMIHGQMNGLGWLAPIAQMLDWTNGCIAVSNAEMDEIIALVQPGTPIAIHP